MGLNVQTKSHPRCFGVFFVTLPIFSLRICLTDPTGSCSASFKRGPGYFNH